MFASTHLRRGMFVLLAIPILYLIVWRVLPAFASLGLSFTEYNMVWNDAPTFVGFLNYRGLLGDVSFWTAMLRSGGFALVATSLEFVLALALALMLDARFAGRNLTIGMLLAPMVMTPAVVGVIWYILYNDRIGPFNYLLSLVGLEGIGWLSNVSTALPSILLADIWQWTPFIFLLFTAYLQSISTELYEAAAVDGASWLQVIRLIKIPLLMRTASVVFLLRFMDAFREFDKVLVMTGGGPGRSSELVTVYIYKTAFQQFDIGRASTMLIVVLVIVSAVYALYAKRTEV